MILLGSNLKFKLGSVRWFFWSDLCQDWLISPGLTHASAFSWWLDHDRAVYHDLVWGSQEEPGTLSQPGFLTLQVASLSSCTKRQRAKEELVGKPWRASPWQPSAQAAKVPLHFWPKRVTQPSWFKEQKNRFHLLRGGEERVAIFFATCCGLRPCHNDLHSFHERNMLTCTPGPLSLDPSSWVCYCSSRLLLYNKSPSALRSWKQPSFIFFFFSFFYLWYVYFKVPRRYTSGEFWARLKPYKTSGTEKVISSALVLTIKLKNNTKPYKIYHEGQRCFAFSENDHFGTY